MTRNPDNEVEVEWYGDTLWPYYINWNFLVAPRLSEWQLRLSDAGYYLKMAWRVLRGR